MKGKFFRISVLFGAIWFFQTALVAQEESARLGGKALKEALKDTADDLWIYDDLKKAYAEGERTGKPVLVSFRCVP